MQNSGFFSFQIYLSCQPNVAKYWFWFFVWHIGFYDSFLFKLVGFSYVYIYLQSTGWWPGLQPDQGEGEKRGRELNLFCHIPCMSYSFSLSFLFLSFSCSSRLSTLKLIIQFSKEKEELNYTESISHIP